MMYVGEKPVLKHIILRLRDCLSLNNEFVLCVNKKHYALIQDYFGNGHNLGVEIFYSISEKPLGTGGEILNARHLIEDDFLLHYGDELTAIELDQLLETHEKAKERGAVATLALVQNVPLEVGTVEWVPEDGVGPKIIEFQEKPPLKKNIWTGIAVLTPEVLKYIKIGDDFGRDVFPRLLTNEKKIYGFISEADWYDCGTLSHYRRVCKLAEEGKL